MIQLHDASLRRLARGFHPVYPVAMMRKDHSFQDIPAMADQIAVLIASRFGGARRGERPPLHVMLRRRGGALPAGLRRRAARLAEADRMSAQPKVARQLPTDRLARDHAALSAHLRPLGEITRWQGRAVSFGAAVAFGVLIVTALAIWVAVQRGLL
ncbi:hypothetical protein [Paracoccus sp. Ld10]|uniref:hypothetical protein n=1 Tax=Paracoccus sp. Ld10 TaxID=649158 RepID=UPI00386B480B